jgi:hypothetical protein
VSAPFWQAGKNYNRGAIVQPISSPAPASAALINSDFESGAVDWTLTGNFFVSTGNTFTGLQSCTHTGTTSPSGEKVVKTTRALVNPGTVINASCYFAQGSGAKNRVVGAVCLVWYDAAGVEISVSEGSFIRSSSGAPWKKSTISAAAPANTARVAIGGICKKTQSNACGFDTFAWDLISQATTPGLLYRAVQAGSGVSAVSEPAWPPTLGVQVNDGTVIWEAVLSNRIEYQAGYILRTGDIEPVWPQEVGGSVSDGTISWRCIGRNIQDEKCPNGTVVCAAVGKVFCGDADIIPYSATANPLDWQDPNNAGYIASGLNQNNTAEISVLHPYRGSLVAFTASTFQNYQVDEDPSLISLLDQMEGIGSIWQNGIQAVENGSFFVSQLGVRSLGVAVGGNNLQANDVGKPIDSLIQVIIDDAIATGGDLISTYYPSEGEYWLTKIELPPLIQPSSLKVRHVIPVQQFSSFEYALNFSGNAGAVSFNVTNGNLGACGAGIQDDSGANYRVGPSGDPPWTPAGEYDITIQVTDGTTTDTIDLRFIIS